MIGKENRGIKCIQTEYSKHFQYGAFQTNEMRSVRGHLMQLRFISSENLVERNKELMRIETQKTKWPDTLI